MDCAIPVFALPFRFMNRFRMACPYLGTLGALLLGVCYFHRFARYHFWAQEGMQAFIPSDVSMCLKPGGSLQYISMFLTQQFISPTLAAVIAGLLLTGVFVCSFRILQSVRSDAVNYVWAFAITIFLMQAYTNYNIFIDGLLGLLLVGVFLLPEVRLPQKRLYGIIYPVVTVILLYMTAQQACMIFAVLWLLIHMKSRPARIMSLCPVILSLVLIHHGLSKGGFPSLFDGIYSSGYQRDQFNPYSFIYHIWIRYSVGLVVSAILTLLIGYIHRFQTGLRCLCGLIPILMLTMGLPSGDASRQHQIQQLAYWNRTDRPQLIETYFRTHPMTDYVQLNYLNLALARQGALADRMFQYRQHGQQGLLTEWDRTALLSETLGDIHFSIGDYSMAESYAVERLASSTRGGSGPALQRLAACALLRADKPLATKYLLILKSMPNYRSWAERQMQLLNKDPRPQGVYSRPDTLSSQVTMDNIWTRHDMDNETAQQYRGCSYLLAGRLDLFKDFVLAYQRHHAGDLLPIHFQQAAMLLAAGQRDLLKELAVSEEVQTQFRQFLRDTQTANSLQSVQEKYGTTFWYYYMQRKLQETEK